MNRCRVLTVGFAAFILFASGVLPGQEAQIQVFIMSGQSNMVGWGSSLQLSDDMRHGLDDVLMFEEGRWQKLKPHRAPSEKQKAGFGISEFTFGPEIGFAHAMAKAWPGKRIGIVKQSVGGTGIMAWAPEYNKADADLTKDGRKGPLYKALMGKVQEARKAAPVEFRAFVWLQGGKDMQTVETGRRYLENLRNLVAAVRRDTGVPDLPVILGSYRSKGIPDDVSAIKAESLPEVAGRPGAALVIKAQWEAQSVIPNTLTVVLRDMPRWPKNVHMNTTGQLRTGELFADAYLRLTR